MITFSKPKPKTGESWIEIPGGYKATRKWAPQIGDIFPNFSLPSPDGTITFHNWAEGRWTVLSSHTAPFSPVCTSELMSLALLQAEFEKAGFSVMSLTVGGVNTVSRWITDIEKRFDLSVDFPVLCDREGTLVKDMGLIHPKNIPGMTIRKSFVIDPGLRVRLMFDFPAKIGRSFEELLRCGQALRISDHTSMAVPADWTTGDPLMPGPDISDEELDKRYGTIWTKLGDYLRIVPMPEAAPVTPLMVPRPSIAAE
ncbi:redoxin domain-containing protein [Lutimaribacter sp. EGI FJ00015]|uniref:Redoxin domain-containing protein n=1 Tax=Lutimaribacter degradans TaxID=2945989 RepID=A0ACC6A187_9RHOB|nr:redoxin domain-containing protein [Lutimaribacter sp. EGI FJ00013]MCM2563840.1 redoxin domain-containing protein [Lutimaribacter sp. EGI FJ00013]MCO0615005.1 redoxin domain-containing protein [Lutimaribacter sp. EGI FJ00015]MCO0637669.1 redoxin domain-containing protein [Lutimaribacter sp. EGI FJ00014]